MKAVVEQEKAAGGSRAQTEFEAFVLNEQCQFTGAFCNSWHCDEMGYLCRIPCWLGKVKKCRENTERIQDICAGRRAAVCVRWLS